MLKPKNKTIPYGAGDDPARSWTRRRRGRQGYRAQGRPYFSAEALANLETCGKLGLSRTDERGLGEFFLEFSTACLQRTRLEAMLDHYLEALRRDHPEVFTR